MNILCKDSTTEKKNGIARLRASVFCITFFLTIIATHIPAAKAAVCCTVGTCSSGCSAGGQQVRIWHADGETALKSKIADAFTDHRRELTANYLPNFFTRALSILTENMSAIIHHHAATIGRLMDAKNQLETQKSIELLKFEAYKHYQPSETFCWFGTNVRSLHTAESKAIFNRNSFNEQALAQQVGKKNTSRAGSRTEAFSERWRNFTANYCNTEDNNFQGESTGLVLACNGRSAPKERQNLDLKYTELIDSPRTIDVDFADGNSSQTANDIIALSNNLYGSDGLTRAIAYMSSDQAQKNYLALRSIAAKRSVAQASFSAIIGLKSKGSDANTKKFLSELIKGVGGDPGEIGDKPSYYAQLEILAKRIYQNPHFYANLYDSPDNIARKSAALKAIELMLEREIAQSESRQEMIMSVLLASDMREQFLGAEQKNSGSVTSGGE